MSTVLFLHGWHSVPGGVKPTFLKDHGHTVINPALDDEDFEAAVRTAQEAFDTHRPEVVIGSSRGGAVAMNIKSGNIPLLLLCPAWKRWGSAKTVKRQTIILHISGCGIWFVADRRQRKPLASIGLSDCKLIAIEHTYDQDAGLVAGTWIDAAIMLIAMKFPETRAAIDLVYPTRTN